MTSINSESAQNASVSVRIRWRLAIPGGYKLGESPKARDLLNVRSTLLLVPVMLSFADVDVHETNLLGSGLRNSSTF